MSKTAKEITFAEHIEAITKAIPDNISINMECRVYWSTKLQEYTMAPAAYMEGTLLRLTIRKAKA